MRHRNAGFKLGRNTSHRRALLRNLCLLYTSKDRKAKIVGYGLQLHEKQKAKRMYFTLESQFLSLIHI